MLTLRLYLLHIANDKAIKKPNTVQCVGLDQRFYCPLLMAYLYIVSYEQPVGRYSSVGICAYLHSLGSYTYYRPAVPYRIANRYRVV